MYDCGLGVKRDYNDSAIGWKMAAEQGCSIAQYCLDRMCRYGQGVKQDAKEVHKWFTLSAEQGHTISQSNLAMLYEVLVDLRNTARVICRI